MDKQKRENIGYELLALSVFRNILNTKTMKAFVSFLIEKENLQNKIEFFGEFVYSLADYDYCFSTFLQNVVLTDENKYILSIAQNGQSIGGIKVLPKRLITIISSNSLKPTPWTDLW